MIAGTSVTRRWLARALACIGALPLGPGPVAVLTSAGAGGVPALLEHLSRNCGARAIGCAYLASEPREVPEDLLRHVSQALKVSLSPSHTSVADLARRVMAADFEAGRVVKLQGWILSVTEVRLYALAHLIGTDCGRQSAVTDHRRA